MSKQEKNPKPADTDPDDAVKVTPPQASPAPPEEEPTSQPDGYMGGV